MKIWLNILLIIINLHAYPQAHTRPIDDLIITNGKKTLSLNRESILQQLEKLQTNEDSIVLPVVFHIVHQNFNSKISVPDVEEALFLLNQGFANKGIYDHGSGVDTKISFCMAKTDPDGYYTTGVNYVYADLPKVIRQIHDTFLKSLIIWDPRKYVNVWVVNDVQLLELINECGEDDIDHSGYATLPPAHGSEIDGIVIEAKALKSPVLIHEMGHYLGLLHPFEGGCKNDDCNTNGDRICDTPPQTKRGAKCDGSTNSCDTDKLSGFTSDQNDLPANFMDYGSCPHDFTEGQKERMRLMIETLRSSLLSSTVCTRSCMQSAEAEFSYNTKDYKIGDSITFNNTSTGASFEWRVNEHLKSTDTTFNFQFPHQGLFKIDLLAKPASEEMNCRNRQINYVQVYCAVKPRIKVNKIKAIAKEKVDFESTLSVLVNSPDPISYQWFYNDTLFSNQPSFSYGFDKPGDKIIYLVTKKGGCIDTSNYEMVTVTPLPDYILQINGIKCTPSGKWLSFTICNNAAKDMPAGLPVSFYYTNPLSTNSKKAGNVFNTNTTIGKFCCEPFEMPLPPDFISSATFLYGVVNDNGSLARPYSFNQFPVTSFEESNYQNNLDSLKLNDFNVSITPKDTSVLLGNTIALASAGNHPYTTISWKAAKGIISCDTCVTTNLEVTGYTSVIATAINLFGCTDTDTAYIRIFIDNEVLVPSAFTPNKDKLNDYFYIIGSKHVAKINSFRIYNRWGEIIFERNHFEPNIPLLGWDGTFKGKDAPIAVYVYYFTVQFADGQIRSYKGTVALIR